MTRVDSLKSISRLLVFSYAALFLIAQSHVSAHFHEDTDGEMSCVVCVVGSQLDDTVAPDLIPGDLVARWPSLAPRIDDQAVQIFTAISNARGPPAS